MSDVQILLARCHALGAELTPTPHGTLKVKAPAPLPEELRQELKQRKAEVLALLIGGQLPPWSCSSCSQPLTIDDVCCSSDGERMLTIWRCDPCGVAGVTPDAIRTPPAVWVKMVKQ
jgi:hypothetical protein